MPTTTAIPPVIETLESPPLPPLQPVTAAERIQTLDVLRGFALFGILVVNVELFGWPMMQAFLGLKVWTSRPDVIADWLVRFLFQGKFYVLFSFLFGLGFAIQSERAAVHSTRFGGWYVRRLLVLLGIGLAHALLLWEGDILVCYALCGFLLLAFRKRKPKTLVIWAIVFAAIPVLFIALIWAIVALASLHPEGAKAIREAFAQQREGTQALVEEELRRFSRGTVGEIFATRARNVLFGWQYVFFYGPTVISMFLLGAYASARRMLQAPEENLRSIRRTLFWGFSVGLPGSVAYVVSSENSSFLNINLLVLASEVALAVSGPALCLAYAAALTLLLRDETWKKRLRPIAAVGQMALSNYLLQSVICTTLFYSYGLGWYGSVGRAEGLGLAVVIYAVQIPLSVWWLNRFRFGPAEWIWRSLTYRKRQPMRREN